MQSAKNTQFTIFNLFANFIRPRDRAVWTNDLLYLLHLLGIEEKTVRSTLSRMKRRGWLTTSKIGRRSQYALTEAGLAMLAEGDQRIFEAPLMTWDGGWQLVVYSLPEERRQLRNQLRKKLMWLGFGNLARGAWVSVQDRSQLLIPILEELQITAHVAIFAGAKQLGTMSNAEIVARCWDIPALSAQYEQFVGHYEPLYQHLNASNPIDLAAEEYFRQYFWLSQDFQHFPRRDPNLPASLLPPNWIGHRAQLLFDEYRQRLEPGVHAFMRQIAGQ